MKNISNNISIIKTLAINELKIKYKRNILGFFWSILNPIINIGLISIVFSKIMDMSYSDFILFLTPGIIAWNFLINIINNCSNCLINNERIIKNIAIDKSIFPLVATISVLIDFILAFSFILLMLIIFFYSKIHLPVIFIPISILFLTIFAMSIGSIVSIANVFFRDFSYVISILLQMLFFLTPILYQKSKLGNIISIAKINPIMHFIDLFRDPIYNGIFPSIETILFALFWCSSSYILSSILMEKSKQQIIFRL